MQHLVPDISVTDQLLTAHVIMGICNVIWLSEEGNYAGSRKAFTEHLLAVGLASDLMESHLSVFSGLLQGY